MYFDEPVHELSFRAGDDAHAFFAALDDAVASGLWACGYFSYELGYILQPGLRHLLDTHRPSVPLAWVGLFREPRYVDTRSAAGLLIDSESAPEYDVQDLRMNTNREEYYGALAHIRTALSDGDTYQVNFTHKYHFQLEGSPEALYLDLRERQPVEYSACIHDGERTILSLSPELFVARTGEHLTGKPMKGTTRRGRTRREDHELAEWLKGDAKNRAENVMIVDMIRNDLGRVAEPGSVEVPSLFDIERHKTLFQMTSTVRATLRRGVSSYEYMEALFPCASVTGAPKLRTMEIIAGLEKGPRGVYTGAIGYISPEGRSCMSVGIRTIVVERNGRAEMGVGSGIVYDSDPAAEYEECRLKGRFLTDGTPEFSLIETMRAEDGVVFLLDEHLERLRESARYFDFPFNPEQIRDEIGAALEGRGAPVRLRLLLHRDGSATCASSKVSPPVDGPARVRISGTVTDSSDVFLYHKTTNRAIYDRERQLHNRNESDESSESNDGIDEVIFLNERGEVTEGTVSNVFVEIDGVLCTPPLSSGLLPGTLRRSLLESGRCVERVITLGDLDRSQALYIGNSVRGLVRAVCEVDEGRESPRAS